MAVGSFAQELQRAVERLVDSVEGGPIAQRGTALKVGESSSVTASVAGKVVETRLATEEPILTGEKIWVGRTKDGTRIVYGGDH